MAASTENSSGLQMTPAHEVAVSVPRDSSPTKKPRVEDALVPMSEFQAVLQQTLAASLGPITADIRTLLTQSARQEEALTSMREELSQTTHRVAELEDRHSREVSDLRAAVVELQKPRPADEGLASKVAELQGAVRELQSPRASSPGASSPGGSGAIPGSVLPTFDLVVGGWCEGEVLSYIQENVNKQIDAAGVRCQVAAIKLYGKRPRSARLQLAFPSSLSHDKRYEQQQVLTKLKQHVWQARGCDKPTWVLIDKPPLQRILGRCVARTSNFLSQKLSLGHDAMEVASWNGLRAYIKEKRVMGSIPAENPLDQCPTHSYARWLERVVWVDLRAIAEATGQQPDDVVAAWVAHFH